MFSLALSQSSKETLWRWYYNSFLSTLIHKVLNTIQTIRFTFWPPEHSRHLSWKVRHLIQTDSDFCHQQADWEVVRRREKLRHSGASDQEAHTVDIFLVLEDWGQNPLSNMRKRRTRQGYV